MKIDVDDFEVTATGGVLGPAVTAVLNEDYVVGSPIHKRVQPEPQSAAHLPRKKAQR